MIEELIDKNDNFELVRDQIAAILLLESTNQKQLAIEAGRTPELWDFRVFTERSNPITEFQTTGENTPIVNVWFDTMEVNLSGSDPVEKQKMTGTYNIDVYCSEITEETETGQEPGDEKSAKSTHRIIRLVRNILMAGEYTYLKMRGVVAGRMVQSVTSFQPSTDDNMIQQVLAARLSFRVVFNELSPQVKPVELELISTKVIRVKTGQILLQVEYP